MSKPSFLAELKRRNVLRAGVLYAGAVWALAQGIAQLRPSFGAPDWITRWFVIAGIIGFPFWLAFAWFYEFTPSGLKRDSEIDPVDSIAHHTGRMLNYWIFGVMAVAIVLLLTNTFVWHKGAPLQTGATSAKVLATTIPTKSIAVLPFENLSNDKNNAYFVAGMQDLILTKLADIGDLKVISRTSTLQYGSHPENLKLVGKQLGVATILEGSVQKAGDQVLINVQLIDSNTDSHIWAQSYQRTLNNIFGVEGEVTQKVADALKARLTPAEKARVTQVPTTNTKAYDAFLQGEYYWSHSFIPRNDETAAGYYDQATAQDPDFVLAWARLTHVLSGIARDSGSPTDAAQAKSALDHALALAPDSPDVRMAQGWYLDYVNKDLDGAMTAFSAVAGSQPNNAQALLAIGAMHAHKGQWKDALGFLRRAVALAPQDKGSLQELVTAYQALHRYPDAMRIAQRLVAVDPSDAASIASLMHSYTLMGDIGGALAAYQASPADARASSYLTYGYAHLQVLRRDYPAARNLLAGLRPVEGLSASTLEIVRGDVEQSAGDTVLAREHYLRARGLYEEELRRNPNSSRAYSGLAWVSAQLGQRKEAMAQATLSIRKDDAQKQSDPFRTECDHKLDMAQIQTVLGDAGAAVKLLDWLLARPTGDLISVPKLKLKPVWDPIRHDPRFQALLKKYAGGQPAEASSAAPGAPSTGATP
jgi:TolB-like protein/Tfp pilus assembly protein PilF